jgi:hypothetical protein
MIAAISSSLVTVINTRPYYICENDISDFHDEVGYYLDVEYSDGSYDTYGPYDTEQQAKSIVY